VGGPTFRKLIGQGYAQRGSELVPARGPAPPPPSAQPRREACAADATAADLGAAAGLALGSEEALRTQGWRVLHVDDAILVVEKVLAWARGSALPLCRALHVHIHAVPRAWTAADHLCMTMCVHARTRTPSLARAHAL